jgi:hypothetical protein
MSKFYRNFINIFKILSSTTIIVENMNTQNYKNYSYKKGKY